MERSSLLSSSIKVSSARGISGIEKVTWVLEKLKKEFMEGQSERVGSKPRAYSKELGRESPSESTLGSVLRVGKRFASQPWKPGGSTPMESIIPFAS